MDSLKAHLTLTNVEHSICAVVAINLIGSAMKSDPRKVWKKVRMHFDLADGQEGDFRSVFVFLDGVRE